MKVQTFEKDQKLYMNVARNINIGAGVRSRGRADHRGWATCVHQFNHPLVHGLLPIGI